MRIRFTIRDLLWLILVIGLLLGAGSFVWDTGTSNVYSPLSNNSGVLFSLFLAILTTATCLARYGGPATWRFAIGYALFGWSFLAFVLRGGFGLDNDFYQQWLLAKYSLVGPMIGLVCGIMTLRLLKPPSEK